MAAIDDVLVVSFPDPERPGLNRIYVENSNQSKGILATILVTGEPNFKLTSVSGALARHYFPHEFVIWVAPGGQRQIGVSMLQRVVSLNPTVFKQTNIQFAKKGAVYVADEPSPFPPPPTHGDQYISVYRIPTNRPGDQRDLVFAVNLNHMYAVKFSAGIAGTPDQYGITLEPAGHRSNGFVTDENAGAYKLLYVEFFEWFGEF